VIVQILVAERDRHDPPHHQRAHRVLDQLRITPRALASSGTL
jgi:hypothetical protein